MAIEGVHGGQCHRRATSLVADAASKGCHPPRQVHGNRECTPNSVARGGCHLRQVGGNRKCTPVSQRQGPLKKGVTPWQVHSNRERTPTTVLPGESVTSGRYMAVENAHPEQCHWRRVSPPGRCMAVESAPPKQCHSGRVSPPAGVCHRACTP